MTFYHKRYELPLKAGSMVPFMYPGGRSVGGWHGVLSVTSTASEQRNSLTT